MTNYEQSTAHEVHTLLLSARPEPNDIHLAKAASLASAQLDMLVRQRDEFRGDTFLAIQRTRNAITDGAGAAEGEQLLVSAIRMAEKWLKACV
jgi:hypothetical protein